MPARATDQGNGWKMKHAKPAHSSSSACSPFVHVCHVTMHKIVLTVVMSDHFGLSVGLWGSLACLVGGSGMPLFARWQRKLRWLGVDDGKLFCRVCPATIEKGLHPHIGHLKQHGRSCMHRSAEAPEPEAQVMRWEQGPSLSDFARVWDHIRAGHSPWQGVQGVGSQSKVTGIRCCLAEALRANDRRFIHAMVDPCSICLTRDESNQRLLLLFNAVNGDLGMRSGLLGWIRCCISDSVKKTDDTACAFRRFCTPRTTPDSLNGTLDAWLYKKLCEKIEFVATDAASSELLSVKMMQQGKRWTGWN